MSELLEKTVFGHTKGPWIYANRFTESGEKPKITTVCWVGDYVIGVPSDYPGGDYRCGAVSESLESDARLIAQAPELLAAARTALGVLTSEDLDPQDAIDELEQAIAKAMGGQA